MRGRTTGWVLAAGLLVLLGGAGGARAGEPQGEPQEDPETDRDRTHREATAPADGDGNEGVAVEVQPEEAPTATTQAPRDLRGVVHVDFVPLVLLGNFGLGYEHILGDRTTLLVSAGYRYWWLPAIFVMDLWSLEVEPHFYLFRDAPEGLYLAPHVSAGRIRAFVGEHNVKGPLIRTGGALGWSFLWGRFNLKLGAGAGVGMAPYMRSSKPDSPEGSTPWIPYGYVDMKMGFVF